MPADPTGFDQFRAGEPLRVQRGKVDEQGFDYYRAGEPLAGIVVPATVTAAATITGTGSLTGAATRTAVAAATLTGTGTLNADGTVIPAAVPTTGGGGGKRRRQQLQTVGRPVTVTPTPARVLVVANRPHVTVGLTTVSPSIGGRATVPTVGLRIGVPTPKNDEYVDAIVRRVPIDLDLPILLAA